jgi:aryl-alcohol dehydrogenase-like predicted oxidoreductase
MPYAFSWRLKAQRSHARAAGITAAWTDSRRLVMSDARARRGGEAHTAGARRGWLRELGASGISTSAISLGLAALGRPGYLNLGHGQDFDDRSVAALADRTNDVLDAAYLAGVRHLDAARSYGRAEEFLGSWLRSRSVRVGEVTISSKWGYTYTADWCVDADPPEVKELTADTFRRQLEETREQLGPYLSLYQIHSATLSSGVLDDTAVLSELGTLRAQGVAVGASVSGVEQGATIERVVETGAFDTVQATWNLLERSAGDALQAAHDAGLGVMIKEGLANGRLSSRGGIEPLARLAEHFGATPDALAIAAILARPWVDTVLSGAATVTQLESNVSAADIVWDATAEAALGSLTEAPSAYWSTRSELPWT